ncbi:BZ3500_MvSof-1268-A1-R1_C158g00809 [Microbotryum saponariae]|uniref:BZ3500_MvSof-1268-A1-R1_C158g00809 protein n=1 Tax=Microbotryum saponariae TaxID=289078 RepID=A0A2X0M6N0_9BASI|nr:BZ3500_MvSof-1268-A1-R1_C158g00809 [Microbotryum saponariae]
MVAPGGTDERGSMVNTLKSSRMAVNSAAAASAQMLLLVAGHCFAPGLGVASDRFDGLDGVEFVGRLLSRCGLTVRAEVWAVHVRWAKASRESVGETKGDDDAANDGDSAGDGDKGFVGDGDEDGSGDGDEDDSVSVELSKVPPVYPGATSTALMAESSREDETSMCADLTSGVLVLTAGAGVSAGTTN